MQKYSMAYSEQIIRRCSRDETRTFKPLLSPRAYPNFALMSNLYSRLGPQGRALIAGGSPAVQGTQYQDFGRNGAAPQELDFLIDELRNPKNDTTVNKILGYMYHSLPTLKQEHNMRLLVAGFLNNSVCFGPEGAPFEENYQIIEAFKVITDKKLKISQPTLSVKKFYNILFQELHNFAHFDLPRNSWKVMPIISGILLSNQLRDDLYTRVNFLDYQWFFQDWDSKIMKLYHRCLNFTMSTVNLDNIINLGLLSFAVTYKRGEPISDYAGNVSKPFLISRLTSLMFSNSPYSAHVYQMFFTLTPESPDLDQVINERIMARPVVKHLNRLSFLLENLFEQLPNDPKHSQVIMDNLSNILSFNKSLSNLTSSSIFNSNDSAKVESPLFQQFWFFQKNVLFAECLIFQGILSRFLVSTHAPGFSYYLNPFHHNSLPKLEADYRAISLKLMESLYYINHILLSIGQGGFDNYNFVYYLALELIFSSKNASQSLETMSMFFIGSHNVNLHPSALNTQTVARTRVLFVLGIWENYLQQKNVNEKFIFDVIFPQCMSIVKNPLVERFELKEACHSVLLFCFSNSHGSQNLKESIDYIELVISQFPDYLSPHQLSIAIETLGKQALSSPVATDGRFHADSGDEFLEFINFKCLNIRSGLPIKKQTPADATFTSAQPIPEISAESTMKLIKKQEANTVDIIKQNKMKKPKDRLNLDVIPKHKHKEYQFENRLVPETTREALILAFINLTPYLPLSNMVKWLDKIFFLIDSSNVSERRYLMAMLWKILSENLDLNRCEIAYRWWYQEKKGPARMLGRVIVPGKF